MNSLYFINGLGVLQSGGVTSLGAIELSEAEAIKITSAFARGASVQESERGWIIVEKPEPTMDEIRLGSAIDRAVFCNRIADLGVITDKEAVAAAKGNWPESMAVFLDYIGMADPPERAATMQRRAQVEWAVCVTVERMNWLVLFMISMGVMTESQVDALFEIELVL